MEDAIFGARSGQFGRSAMLVDEVLVCCDLASASFADGRLERVMFFGCDLTGADFSEALIDEVRFVHCYSAPASPVDFTHARPSALWNEGSSLSARGPLASSISARWPADADACAASLRTARNDVRYQTIKEIAGSPRLSELLYPFLGISLLDPEWEVRQCGLEALVAIRDGSDTFKEFDPWMKEWMLHCLCDPSAFVRATIKRLLPAIAPDDEQLRRVLAGSASDPIGGLRACETLLRLDKLYAALMDFAAVGRIAVGPFPAETRLLAIDVLEAADDPILLSILPALTADLEREIRARAVNALGIVSVPNSDQLTRSATRDPDWRVRLQALDTAEDLGCLDSSMIDAAMRDPAEQIREFALARRRR